MEIKPNGFYPINEAQKYLNWSKRKLQRYASKNRMRKVDGRYLFTGKDILDILTTEATTSVVPIDTTIATLIRQIDDNDYIREVLTAIKQGSRLEEMTEDEYQQFVSRLKEANQLERRIIEYKEEIARMEGYVQDYRQNVEYLRKSLDSQHEQMSVVLNSIQRRSYIEAKEKGFDKDI